MYLVGTVYVKGDWFPCRIRKDREKLYCTILDTLATQQMGMTGLELEFPRGDTRVRYNPKWAKNSMADEANVSDVGEVHDPNFIFELESIDNDSVTLQTGSDYTVEDSTEVIFPPAWKLETYNAAANHVQSNDSDPNINDINPWISHHTDAGDMDVHVPFDHRKIQVQEHHQRELVRQKKEAVKQSRKERRNSDHMFNILKKEMVQKSYLGQVLNEDEHRKHVFVKKVGYKSAPNYVEFGCSKKKYDKITNLIKKDLDELDRDKAKAKVSSWKKIFGCYRPDEI